MADNITDIIFKIPKQNIKKLNTVFNLDAMPTDEYKLVLLKDVAGLSMSSLDKYDTNMLHRESSDYNIIPIRPDVQLEVSETVNGFIIRPNPVTAEIPNDISLEVAGLLIIKDSTKDILAAFLGWEGFVFAVNFSIAFNGVLAEFIVSDEG